MSHLDRIGSAVRLLQDPTVEVFLYLVPVIKRMFIGLELDATLVVFHPTTSPLTEVAIDPLPIGYCKKKRKNEKVTHRYIKRSTV